MKIESGEICPHAKWIWPDGAMWDLHNCYALFRKVFFIRQPPAVLFAYITADQSYQLWINGRYVCRGPARGFQSHWPCDKVDISGFLHKGRNVIAVRAYNPGYSNFQYQTQGMAGFLFSASWHDGNLVSDASWRCRRQDGVKKDMVPSSIQLFGQENIDLRVEPTDWMDLSFDDSDWQPFEIAEYAWNSMPWFSLEQRGIPLLRETARSSHKLIGTATGLNVPGFESTRDIFFQRASEDLGHQPCSATTNRITVQPFPQDCFRSYLFAFCATQVGVLEVSVDGALGDEIVDITYYETLDETTLAPHAPTPLHCRNAFGNRLVCKAGRFRHRFYHIVGFKYFVVTVRRTSVALSLSITLQTAGYPLEIVGEFISSDRTLNRIWKACAWTQQCCMLDAYVDTPWREQAQWWGDARVQAANTFFLSGDTRLLRRGMSQIASQTTPDGVTYGHSPTIAHACILLDFTITWMLTLWDYYWQTGSIEPFQHHQRVLVNALNYFRNTRDHATGLVGWDKRFALFLDWADLFKDGYSAGYNLWLLLALDKMTLLYEKSGCAGEAQDTRIWAKVLRKSLETLIQPNGLVADGRHWNGDLVFSFSVHTQTLAIMNRLDSKSEDAIFHSTLLPLLRGRNFGSAQPSAFWINYIYELLIEYGHGLEVVRHIRKRWASMADYGSTWESFTPIFGDQSHSHAWSAHPICHLMRAVGGIRQNDVAWRKIVFSPVIFGTSAKVVVPTPSGNIRAHWLKRRSRLKYCIHLPDGIHARIELPTLSQELLSGTHEGEIDVAPPK